MDKHKAGEIFARFQAQDPHPKTELIHHSPFELLIAVILSAQATDVRVNKVTFHLFALANTASAMLDLGLHALKSEIKSIGLYNAKAENIIKTCKLLVAHHQGEVPGTRSALEALPGVGRKTANVVLNTIFGQPCIAVDTHIFRVANRTGLAHAATPLKVEHQLMQVVPSEFLLGAHHWLVLHGRYVCTARKPHCGGCIIRDLCEWPFKSS